MSEVNQFANLDLKALGIAPTEQAKKKNDQLDQADFMKLLVTQLENQNPMEPQDNSEFVSQIAQFGMLEGITGLNTQFSTLSSSLTSSQALEASSLVGRQVVVPADSAIYDGNGAMFGTLELPSSVPDLTLSISDANGSLVMQQMLGTQAKGTVPFLWDGKNSSGQALPAGEYKVTATATVDGQTQSIATNLTFNVDSVTLGKNGSGLTLNLAGHDPVKVDQVKEIR